MADLSLIPRLVYDKGRFWLITPGGERVVVADAAPVEITQGGRAALARLTLSVRMDPPEAESDG
jgi:hypothetical protein